MAEKPLQDEDDDVQQERERIRRGDGRITDALRLENLTKVLTNSACIIVIVLPLTHRLSNLLGLFENNGGAGNIWYILD